MKNGLIGFLAVALVLSIGAVLAFGPQFSSSEERQQFQEDMQTYHDAVEAAVEAGDYSAWKDAMADRPQPPRMEDVVTEDNWDTFVAMHQAMEDGDYETAQSLREELGLGNGRMGGGFGGPRGHGFHGDCPMMDDDE